MFRGDILRVIKVVEQRVTLMEKGGEGDMARQCTQSKRPNKSKWFKEKMLIAQDLESMVILDEEQLEFLADPGDRVKSGPNTQTLPTTAIFKTDDLDAFDSDCDEAPSTRAVLMAKLSSYDSDVLDVVFDGAFGGVRDEEVVVREGVVVCEFFFTDMLTNNCLGGIMVSLIFLEGLDEEALVEFIV
ncbi:hypothetical protein Tco_0195569 [Tanacetum coccineum]